MLCSGPFDWPFSVKLKSKSLLLWKLFDNSKNLKPFQFGNIDLVNCVTTYTKPQYLNSRCFCILFCTNYFILHHDICSPNPVYVLRIAWPLFCSHLCCTIFSLFFWPTHFPFTIILQSGLCRGWSRIRTWLKKNKVTSLNFTPTLFIYFTCTSGMDFTLGFRLFVYSVYDIIWW